MKMAITNSQNLCTIIISISPKLSISLVIFFILISGYIIYFEVFIVAFERPLFPNFDKIAPYIRYGIYFGVLLVTDGITFAVFGVIYLCNRKLKFCGKKSPHDDDEESRDHEESSDEE
uniref:SJCHGC02292 protein n=1 Tax=Schistosoma japonicum TaxID=6182 RepID=Q5DI70_SCHJA|nr:SJCHGC02292 protein [Schistosoma japonicum]